MTLPSIITAVVYHSGYGHTKRVAEAVAEGAAASLIAIDAEGNIREDGWETLNAADAIIFGSPTYMGGPSWQFKKFADTSSKPWFEDKWKNKVFGGFTNSASINGDKLNTLQYFVLLAGQHGGLWVSLAIKPANVKASKRDDPNRMGSYIAPMAQSDADAAPGEMSEGDLETARLYGVRVAEIASRFAAVPSASAQHLTLTRSAP
jgi:NAD(P)H dehydrogenase (quinone)